MKVTLSGKEFTLRCDMRALAAAQRDGVNVHELGDDFVQVGTLVYHMAQSGAKHADVPFKHKLDDFLGLIDVQDLEPMMLAVTEVMTVKGAEKKS